MPGERRSAGHGAVVDGPAGAESLFERVLDHLPTGVLVADRDLKIVFVNVAALGLLRAETPPRAGLHVPDPWPELSLPALVESLFSDEPAVGVHLVEADKSILRIEGLPAGQSAIATVLLEDVTERERIRRAERQFVQNASHELRTPLAAIVSVIDVLDDGAKDDPETRDRFLAHIRAHSDRLVRLANSLLTLARIQTGREHPHLDLVRVRPLLDEVAAMLPESPETAVTVRAAEDVTVLADPELLYHALENVAANAIKYTRRGSVLIEARDLGRTVEIDLTDTGCGMDVTGVEHAFDRFYRSGIGERDGFGLGLAIANEAIRAMNGTIDLDSIPNVGTRVRICLASARIVAR